MLERRAEDRVVDRDERLRGMRARDPDRVRDVAHPERRVRRRLDEEELQVGKPVRGLRENLAIPCRYADDVEAERLEHLMHEVLGAAVQRTRVQK
jgi:hypothetical protein